MKKMIYNYKNRGLNSILDTGFYQGYEYVILNLHTHPCAYICLTKDNPFYQKHYDDIPLLVHGGLTFSDNHLCRIEEYSEKYKCVVNTTFRRDWIIGWDYAHLGDCYDSILGDDGKKYTTEEILNDVMFAIEQLRGLIDNDIYS